MKYQEIRSDLFNVDTTYVLAHCVSQDCKMGAGIAKEFRRRFPAMPNQIFKAYPKIGQAIPYQGDNWLIFNLITKAKYWDKPTYDTFTASIVDLKNKMVEAHLSKLAIPLLGAGLDKLSWTKNREIISEIFLATNIEILVCRKD